MPMLIANGRRIFFCHVPKTGGSSVEDYLIRRFGGPLSLRDVTHRRGDRRRGMISLSTHLTAADLEDVPPHDLDRSFAVVRDPLERTFSQFRFQDGVSRTRRFGLRYRDGHRDQEARSRSARHEWFIAPYGALRPACSPAPDSPSSAATKRADPSLSELSHASYHSQR